MTLRDRYYYYTSFSFSRELMWWSWSCAFSHCATYSLFRPSIHSHWAPAMGQALPNVFGPYIVFWNEYHFSLYCTDKETEAKRDCLMPCLAKKQHSKLCYLPPVSTVHRLLGISSWVELIWPSTCLYSMVWKSILTFKGQKNTEHRYLHTIHFKDSLIYFKDVKQDKDLLYFPELASFL